MGVHVANKGIKTSNCGLYRDVFFFEVGGAGAVGDVFQAGANFVTSVTHTDPGVYTVQLNKLYPVRVISVVASLAADAVDADTRWCRYKANSYDASTGTFVIHVSKPTDDTHATTQVAVDPESGAEVHVCIDYVAMTTGIGD